MLKSQSTSFKNQMQMGGHTSYPTMFKNSNKQIRNGFMSQDKGLSTFVK